MPPTPRGGGEYFGRDIDGRDRANRTRHQTEPPTLLPTPAASNPNDGEDTDQWLARRARVKARIGNGNGMGMPLTIAAQLIDKGSHAVTETEEDFDTGCTDDCPGDCWADHKGEQ